MNPSSATSSSVLSENALSLLPDPFLPAVGCAHPVDETERAFGRHRFLHLPDHVLAILRMDDPLIGVWAAAEQLGRLVAEKLDAALAGKLHRIGFIGLAAVDQSRQVVHQGAEPALALEQVVFSALLLRDVKAQGELGNGTVRIEDGSGHDVVPVPVPGVLVFIADGLAFEGRLLHAPGADPLQPVESLVAFFADQIPPRKVDRLPVGEFDAVVRRADIDEAFEGLYDGFEIGLPAFGHLSGRARTPTVHLRSCLPDR